MSWTEAEKDDFFKHLTMVAETLAEPMTPVRLAGYCAALEDLPLSAVVHAMGTAVKTCRFFPKPAEIREFAEGAPDDLLEVAWQQMREAMHTIGYARSVMFADTRLADAVERVFGSWPAACGADWSDEMWAAKRKEFGRVYRALKLKESVHRGYLLGASEAQNRSSIMGAERFLRAGLSELSTEVGFVPLSAPPVLVPGTLDVRTGAVTVDSGTVAALNAGVGVHAPRAPRQLGAGPAPAAMEPVSQPDALAAIARLKAGLIERHKRDLLVLPSGLGDGDLDV